MTGALIIGSDKWVEATTDNEDDIESELAFSAREAGVACYLIPDAVADEGSD